jgi:hypothetical protein
MKIQSQFLSCFFRKNILSSNYFVQYFFFSGASVSMEGSKKKAKLADKREEEKATEKCKR